MSEKALDTNGRVGRLARGSVSALSIHLAGAGATFLAQLVVARTVGTGSYGIYAYVFAWVSGTCLTAVLWVSTFLCCGFYQRIGLSRLGGCLGV